MVVIDESRISGEKYRELIEEHLLPETIWQWTRPGHRVITFRVTSMDDDTIYHERCEFNQIDPEAEMDIESMGPDTGWVLTQVPESTWLECLLESQ